MPSPTNILIADDHPIVRKGLRLVIESDPKFRVVAEASNGQEALDAMRLDRIHVAILDIDMPVMDGLEAMRQMTKARMETEVIFLSMHSGPDLLYSAMDLGAKGYTLKDSALVEILTAIRSVLAGKHYVSQSLTGLLVSRTRKVEEFQRVHSGLDALTPMERKVLKAVAANRTSREIGEELFIHYRTVENHRTNICNKLEIHGPNALLKFALQNKDKL